MAQKLIFISYWHISPCNKEKTKFEHFRAHVHREKNKQGFYIPNHIKTLLYKYI